MIYKGMLFVLILLACSPKQLDETSRIKKVDLAIENVQIFNSVTKEVLKNKTILISGNKIEDVISQDNSFQAKVTIDGKNRLVVPGFIDTHTHLTQIFGDGNEIAPEYISNNISFRQVLAQQYLNYGVTTILDLGQPEKWLDVSMQWQNETSTEYPNQFNAGGALISDYDWEPNMNHAEILNGNHAYDKLKSYSEQGIKHIKLYSFLKETDLRKVLAAAKEYDITPFGHLDRGEINIPKALELGIKNFEHFFTVVNGVLTTSDHWAEFNDKYQLGRIRSVDEWAAAMVLYFDYIDSKPELNDRLNDLMDQMAQQEVSISTTISVFASLTGQSNFFTSFQNFPLRSAPYFPSYTNLDQAQLQKAFDTLMRNLKKAHDKGVKIRIGTDCRFGGNALLSECILMAQAGFNIADIMQIATLNGAKAMQIDDQYGSIEKGKIADLVIFNKNPFDDEQHFLSEKSIIKNGKIYVPKKDIVKDMYNQIEKVGIDEALVWYNTIRESEDYYKGDGTQLNDLGCELLKNNKAKEAVRIFKYSMDNFKDAGIKYNSLDEARLNGIGYHYLELKNSPAAIEVFEYNASLYPDSWNVFDSLGEVYLLVGNLKLAKDNYKKSLALNPENTYAIEALERIKTQENK